MDRKIADKIVKRICEGLCEYDFVIHDQIFGDTYLYQCKDPKIGPLVEIDNLDRKVSIWTAPLQKTRDVGLSDPKFFEKARALLEEAIEAATNPAPGDD